eukprot:842895_1
MAKTKRTTKSASTSRSAKRTTKRTNATRSEPTKKKNTKQYLQLMTIDDSKYIGFYCGFSIRKSSICIISRNKEANHDKTLLENIAWCIQNMSCVPQFIDAKHIEANMLSKHKFAWSDLLSDFAVQYNRTIANLIDTIDHFNEVVLDQNKKHRTIEPLTNKTIIPTILERLTKLIDEEEGEEDDDSDKKEKKKKKGKTATQTIDSEEDSDKKEKKKKKGKTATQRIDSEEEEEDDSDEDIDLSVHTQDNSTTWKSKYHNEKKKYDVMKTKCWRAEQDRRLISMENKDNKKIMKKQRKTIDRLEQGQFASNIKEFTEMFKTRLPVAKQPTVLMTLLKGFPAVVDEAGDLRKTQIIANYEKELHKQQKAPHRLMKQAVSLIKKLSLYEHQQINNAIGCDQKTAINADGDLLIRNVNKRRFAGLMSLEDRKRMNKVYKQQHPEGKSAHKLHGFNT